MRTKITIVITLLITIVSFAQNGINYKAVIKDGNGNVIANDLIEVQFAILQGATTVYEETHSPTTDDNGIIIVNIGEGSPISGTFTSIDWASDEHFLNVKVNTGSGLTDMGTTQFKTVPYALNAANATGLDALDEGKGIGWRLKGRESANYGDIGANSIDLSYSFSSSTTKGATGNISAAMGGNTTASGTYSTAIGVNTTASQISSTAMGSGATASGITSTAMGNGTTASGNVSTAMGSGTQAPSYVETVIGRYNTTYTPDSATTWDTSDRLFVIGNGTASGSRSNAMTVFKNGRVGIGTDQPHGTLDVNGRIYLGGGAVFLEYRNSYQIACLGNFVPTSTDAASLGTSFARWYDIYASNGTINTSDRREKTNIASLDYGLNEIMQLQPVRFNWKSKPDADKKLGLIAQDLLKVIPEVVKTHEDVVIDEKDPTQKKRVEMERMGVYYSDLIPVLIKAIQELKEENDGLKARIENLENK